jgi:hypothetical protein
VKQEEDFITKKFDTEMQSEDSQLNQPNFSRNDCNISVDRFTPKRNTFQTPNGGLNRIKEQSNESSVNNVQDADLSKNVKQELGEEFPENGGKENLNSYHNIDSKVSARNLNEKLSKKQNVTQQPPIDSPIITATDFDKKRISISQPNNDFSYNWINNPVDSIAYTKHKALQK